MATWWSRSMPSNSGSRLRVGDGRREGRAAGCGLARGAAALGAGRFVLGWLLRPAMVPQIEKLVPQPHDAVALGLWILTAWPMRSSTKSISETSMYGSETESISTTAPWRSMTKSLGARVASKSKPYWKPEHPPPETLTRSAVPAGSAESRRAMRLAALSDKVTAPAAVSITLGKFGKALSFLVLTPSIVKSSSRSCQCRGALLHRSTSNYFDF